MTVAYPLLISDIQPEEALLPWLECRQSLTGKLKADRGEATLDLLSSLWRPVSWGERFIYGLSEPSVFQREILMSSEHRPCWYARTVIPISCYESEPAFFKRLEQGEQLNALIFNEPKVKPIQFFYYPVDPCCIEFHWLAERFAPTQTPVWVRRSDFLFLGQNKFYLSEIFLNSFVKSLA